MSPTDLDRCCLAKQLHLWPIKVLVQVGGLEVREIAELRGKGKQDDKCTRTKWQLRDGR